MKTRLFLWLQYLTPQHLLSRVTGFFADSEITWLKSLAISLFSKAYDINFAEAERSNPADYRSFNDFFTRALAPDARPISGRVTCPADGVVSALGRIEDGTILQAKGHHYSVAKLMGLANADHLTGGSFITIYLAPHNYHRVHIPRDCTVTEARYLPGKLFSVNQVTADNVPDLFAINERLACDIDGEDGREGYVMVGAMIVAGIRTVWHEERYPVRKMTTEQPGLSLDKGAEFGQFELGSTVIYLTSKPLDFLVSPGEAVQVGQPLAD